MIQWCGSCRDGGEVVICTTCETNSICYLCADFKLEDEKDHISLECPPCFQKKDEKALYLIVFLFY